MNMRLSLLAVLLLLVHYSKAQFSGTNLTEYQYGALPTQTEDNFQSVYNKLMLNYTYKNLKVTAGGQMYYSPYEDRNYFHPSWLGLNYIQKGWDLKLGNFYETLDRGILLRSYEIPGALLEDQGFRSKNYFYRDVEGAAIRYSKKNVTVKALWGYSLNNLYPPTQARDLRRSDEIVAFSFQYKIAKQAVGLSGLQLYNSVSEASYALGSLTGKLTNGLSYYSAYAAYVGGDIQEYSSNDSRAIYGSLNYSLGNFGMSLEYKDYKNFVIGSGINEPPALIKEHSYKVLNRSTHVLLPDNEKGFQAEAFYQLGLWTVLTFNYTMADNDFGKKFSYREYFLELSTSIGQKTDLKLFSDFAQDPLKGDENRISTGFQLDQSIAKKYGTKLEGEYQTFQRFGERVNNVVAILTIRRLSKTYLSLISEFSNDVFVTSQSNKAWLGASISHKINSNNSVQIFAGERRGGPACSAGICYEVLDFKGVELRYQARF